MSIKAINWALNVIDNITGTQKAVLFVLADRADDNGYCYPTYDDICRRSCVDRHTVSNAIKKFVELGIVTKHRRFSKSTIYQLHISGEISTKPISGDIRTSISGEIHTQSSVKTPTLTIIEPSKESPWMSRWSEFWKKYPSKKNKHKSQIAFKNLSAKDQKAAIEGVGSYEFSKDRRYVPMASTWLNGRRWEDFEDDNEEIREFEL